MLVSTFWVLSSLPAMMYKVSVNADWLCHTLQTAALQTRRSSVSLSHLCTSSPCLPLTGRGSCDWPTAGLWSSSLDCSDLRRQTCTFVVPCRSTRARRQTAPRTHRAGLCSPPEQSHLPGPAQLAGPCRKGGSPWAQTSVSDTKSLSHPVGQWFAV